MLLKCITTRASLLVPDIEDSVPQEEKATARSLIKSKLKFLRENAAKGVVITPRVNGVWTGSMFEDDIKGVIDASTHQYIDGFCVPKVDSPSDMMAINSLLSSEESKYGLEPGHFKVIPQIESTKSLVYMKDIFELD